MHLHIQKPSKSATKDDIKAELKKLFIEVTIQE